MSGQVLAAWAGAIVSVATIVLLLVQDSMRLGVALEQLAQIETMSAQINQLTIDVRVLNEHAAMDLAGPPPPDAP